MKVFLGGTVNKSTWREYIMPRLEIDYFNPVVEDWNEQAYQRELYEKKTCEFCLFVLTPKMTGYFSIAEVVDEAYKRPDRTILCYLTQDEDDFFDEAQKESLELLYKIVESNGAIYLKTLDDIIKFLNDSKSLDDSILRDSTKINDVFISYGRKHSKNFATKLCNVMKNNQLDVWFDQNDIPLGVDFQEQIDEGIRRAHNFVFIISPHSVRSEYCLKEVVLAESLNKRIIPLLHVMPEGDMDKMHPLIQKLNWIYIQEGVDDYKLSFTNLMTLILADSEYVKAHTRFLIMALEWEKRQRSNAYLIPNQIIIEAEQWLTYEFTTKQAPCLPSTLQADYICESKKATNHFCIDIFLCYGISDNETAMLFYHQLNKKGIVSWTKETDVKAGDVYEEQAQKGVERAANIVFLISQKSLQSQSCLTNLNYAFSLNKRIVPVLLEEIDNKDIPQYLKTIFFINYTTKSDKQLKEVFAKITTVLKKDQGYVEQHRNLLIKSLEWDKNHRYNTFLLHDKERENAERWLSGVFKSKETLPVLPTDFMCEFICESKKMAALSMTDAFFCYAREDAEILKSIRMALMRYCTTSWVDLLEIKKGVRFGEAINEGIEQADVFLFLISPNSVVSKYCLQEINYALKLNKRIIPLYLRETDQSMILRELIELQYIDFSKLSNYETGLFKHQKSDFDKLIEEVISVIAKDSQYYNHHKVLTTRAIIWEKQEFNRSILLRGNDLDKAETWLKIGKERKQHPPTELQQRFIEESRKLEPDTPSEVFISCLTDNFDFATYLNQQLQNHGKTTDFDNWTTDFPTEHEQNIFNSIEQSDNFLFVVSNASVASEFCNSQVEFAKKLSKKIVCLLCENIQNTENKVDITSFQKLNFIADEKDFEVSFRELIRVLDTDKEHVINHSKWSKRALEWDKNDRNKNLLLRANELVLARQWLLPALNSKKIPLVSALQEDFINRSFEQQTTEQNKKADFQKNSLNSMAATKKRMVFLSIVNALIIILICLASYTVIKGYDVLNKQRTYQLTNIAYDIVKTSADLSIKTHLISKTHECIQLCNYYYQQYKLGKMTEQQAYNTAVNLMLDKEFGKIGETGYIAGFDSKGNLKFHPHVKTIDLKKYPWVLDAILKRKEYIEYQWKNPKDSVIRQKAGALAYFEPWDLMLWVNSYKTEFSKLVKLSDFRQELLNIKFGKTGYVYVLNSKGDVLIHPQLEGKNVANLSFVKEILTKKSGEMYYMWKNPNEKRERQKYVIFHYIDFMDWIVCGGIYDDENFLMKVIIISVTSLLIIISIGSILLGISFTKPLQNLVNSIKERDENAD